MPGTKTNERPGTRATVKFLRVSAYKAREVLDLIRGLPVDEARSVLQFTERAVSRDISKLLDSVTANAVHNDEQDEDELYVSACFADEGPTLKRWRPRARGRATRIRKRTTHVTIIVSRMTPEQLDKRRNRAQAAAAAGRATRSSAETRRARVARSRQRAEAIAEAEAAEEAEHDHEHDHDEVDEDAEVPGEPTEDTIEAVEEAAEEAEVETKSRQSPRPKPRQTRAE